MGAVGDLSHERTSLQMGLASFWEGVIQRSFVVIQGVESLKAWQMVGAAISWDASQLMMTSSSSWDTWWGVSHWWQEHLLQNSFVTNLDESVNSSKPTQPSFAARGMLILSSSNPSAASSAGLLEQYCPRDWVVHWWDKRMYPFPKQGIKREHRTPCKNATWNQCAGMPVLGGRLEASCHHSLFEGGTQGENHAVTQEEAAQTKSAARKIRQRHCCQVHRCVE